MARRDAAGPALTRVCVYAGSSPGTDPHYAEAAGDLARAIVSRGTGIVYGGGNFGLMGALADAALAAGGDVVGIIPEGLLAREVGHHGATELIVVGSMHERKARMADMADAFIALPGGIGTLEELIEVFTWSQLGMHDKAVSVLNVAGYWDGLLDLLDRAVAHGFLDEAHRGVLIAEDDPERLLDALEAWEPPSRDRWISRAET